MSCLVKTPLVYLVAESLGDVQGPRIWLKFGAFPAQSHRQQVRLCKNQWFILKWSRVELNSQDFWWQGLRQVVFCNQFHSCSRSHGKIYPLVWLMKNPPGMYLLLICKYWDSNITSVNFKKQEETFFYMQKYQYLHLKYLSPLYIAFCFCPWNVCIGGSDLRMWASYVTAKGHQVFHWR